MRVVALPMGAAGEVLWPCACGEEQWKLGGSRAGGEGAGAEKTKAGA
jgi:hypothetical protein